MLSWAAVEMVVGAFSVGPLRLGVSQQQVGRVAAQNDIQDMFRGWFSIGSLGVSMRLTSWKVRVYHCVLVQGTVTLFWIKSIPNVILYICKRNIYIISYPLLPNTLMAGKYGPLTSYGSTTLPAVF